MPRSLNGPNGLVFHSASDKWVSSPKHLQCIIRCYRYSNVEESQLSEVPRQLAPRMGPEPAASELEVGRAIHCATATRFAASSRYFRQKASKWKLTTLLTLPPFGCSISFSELSLVMVSVPLSSANGRIGCQAVLSWLWTGTQIWINEQGRPQGRNCH